MVMSPSVLSVCVSIFMAASCSILSNSSLVGVATGGLEPIDSEFDILAVDRLGIK